MLLLVLSEVRYIKTRNWVRSWSGTLEIHSYVLMYGRSHLIKRIVVSCALDKDFIVVLREKVLQQFSINLKHV